MKELPVQITASKYAWRVAVKKRYTSNPAQLAVGKRPKSGLPTWQQASMPDGVVVTETYAS